MSFFYLAQSKKSVAIAFKIKIISGKDALAKI